MAQEEMRCTLCSTTKQVSHKGALRVYDTSESNNTGIK